MKIKNKIVAKFQEGGAMPESAPAEQAPEQAPAGGGGTPAEGGGQDPISQLLQLATQAIDGQDCEAAMAVCQGFVQLVQAQAGGGGAGASGAAPAGEPVYKKGGKIVKRV